MKNIIKQPEIEYICDICGEVINCDGYNFDNLVKITNDEIHGNGWNDWTENKEYHVHKQCISDVFAKINFQKSRR